MSVQKALEYLNISSVITSDAKKISQSDGIILPGVGAFPYAMERIKTLRVDEVLLEAADRNIPILGICLGMQLLFQKGYEVEECGGIGLIKGEIKKIECNYKIPHMGWNNIKFLKDSPIIKDIEQESYFYFVHSFYADMKEEDSVNAYCEYGIKIPAIVSSKNVFGFQFHPEKSGKVGLKLLKNYVEMIK